MSLYQNLFDHFKKISDLEHVQAINFWDEASMMPVGGGEVRGEALATLGVLIHELKTEERIGEWLDRVTDEELSGSEAANIREMARQHREATCLTGKLVGELERSSSRCEQRTSNLADVVSAEPLFKSAGWHAACRNLNNASNTCIFDFERPLVCTIPNKLSR